MGEEKKVPEEPKDGDPPKAPESPWTGLWKSVGDKLGPALVSLIVSVGFVAFAGKAVLWARFSALQVPADQVVKAVPEGEAVAVGASMLLLFGLVGLLGALGVFLVDRGGRATPGMSRGLLAILAVESLVAIWIVEGKSVGSQVIASEVVLLAIAVIFWSTFVAGLVTHEAEVPDYKGDEERESGERRAFFRVEEKSRGRNRPPTRTEKSGLTTLGVLLGLGIAIVVGAAGYAIALLVDGSSVVAWIAAIPAAGLVLLGAVVQHRVRFRQAEKTRARLAEEEDEQRAKAKEELEKAEKAARKAKKKAKKKKKRKQAEKRARREERRRAKLYAKWKALCGGCRSGASVVFVNLTPTAAGEPPQPKAPARVDEEEKRTKPPGVELTLWGVLLTVALVAVIVAVPSLILHEWWLAVSLGTVAVLGIGLWRIALLSTTRFVWYGLAVFISVPLFGTVMLMARNIDEPQVQPMALIRSTDGPDEAIQGLYVTEASDRVYFANVATEGCQDKIKPDSGRLLWVPRKEVVAMSIGPLQSVEEAGKTALEMSYSLTPATETPSGDNGSLTTSEQRARRAEEETVPSKLDQRLENAGPAVRPNFGSGLTLIPETASPGEEVTLRMSVPNEENGVEGFGRTPEGRALRLNGVRLAVLRQTSPTAREAEYVRTEGTKIVLAIAKQTLYRKREDGSFALAGPNESEAGLFVKLEDSRIASVRNGTENSGLYVELEGSGALARAPEVQLAESGEWQPLEKRLLRQAWSPTEIKFRVPDNAGSGVVSVECEQLAGQPLLRVTRAPTARIAVQMRSGSAAVVLDGSRSSDEDEAAAGGEGEGKAKAPGADLTRRWTIEGVPAGHHPTARVRLSPRVRPYSVELTVTDKSGNSDTATLQLLRLPTSLFAFDHSRPEHPAAIHKARKGVEKAVAVEKPVEVELDGHADNPGTPAYNMKLSLERDDHVREALLRDEKQAEAGAQTVPVQELAYGESCQLEKGAGRRPLNRRVDVFVLSEGVTVRPPEGCHPGRLKSMRWHPPPPTPSSPDSTE